MISYSPSVVTNGLKLYLDAGNVKSYPGTGTVWTDISGNGNNATLYNGPTYSSANGGSLVFDGVNDYAEGLMNIVAGSAFTTNTWFNITNNSREQHLTNLWPSTQFYVASAALRTSNYGALVGGSVSASVWYMASQVRAADGSGVLYLNGVSVATGTLPSNPQCNGYTIGNFVGGGSYYFGGYISMSQIYNRALTAAEITQNFNALRGRYGL